MSEPDPGAPDPRAVASEFGLGPPLAVTFVTRTLSSNIWCLETDTGKWAVKQQLGSSDAKRCEEVFALETAAALAGVPLPRPMATVRAQRAVAAVPRRAGPSAAVRVWPWIDLSPIPSPTPTRTLVQLGAALARLHSLAAPTDTRPYQPWYRDPPEDRVWIEFVSLAEKVDAPWASALAGAVDDLRDLAALARTHPPLERSSWCHFDLLQHNCGLDEEGNLVILDWDDAAPGDPGRELGSAVVGWSRPNTARLLIDAYRENRGPARLDTVACMSIVVTFRLNYLEVVARAALDQSSPESARAMASGEVARLLSDPITVDLLQAYLTAR